LGDLLFDTETIMTGEEGIVEFNFVNDAEVFDLSVFVMDNSKKVIHEVFKGLNANDGVSLILFPGLSLIELDSEKAVEENFTINESVLNESIVNETENLTTPVMGFAVADEEDSSGISKKFNFNSKFVFYFIGGFILLGFLFLFFNKMRKEHIKVSNSGNSVKVTPPKSDKDEGEDLIKDAESKMAEAEADIKIADDEKRIKEDGERLMKDKECLRRIRESRLKQQ
jgi:hypothetical protein